MSLRSPIRGDSVWDEPALGGASVPPNDEARVLHGVADEPILATQIAMGAASFSFADWYAERQAATTWARSWSVTVALMATGGVFAVLGAFMNVAGGSYVIVYALIVPVLEEILKVSPALILLERFPYLFRSGAQPWLVVIATALSFAVIENLLYLNVYIAEPSDRLRAWRWTVCTLMHVSASSIAGIGLYRLYLQTSRERRRVNLDAAFPFFVAAAALHGAYNFSMLMLAAAGIEFLS